MQSIPSAGRLMLAKCYPFISGLLDLNIHLEDCLFKYPDS